MLFRNITTRVTTSLYYLVGFVRASVLGVRLGANARVSPHARIRGVAFIGDAVIGRDVEMGHSSYVNSGEIAAAKIGAWCSIGYGVLIGPTEHDLGFASTSPNFANNEQLVVRALRSKLPPPVIEDDVWIGAHAVILRGVRIGRGAVIGAAAVVTRDVPEYSIAVGVPARVIRTRFEHDSSQQTATKLLEERAAAVAAAIAADG